MNRRLAGLLSALWLFGCAKTIDPFPNKNTNWLRECSSSRTCGAGLSCVCGVCTAACNSAAQCGASGSNAVCESTASDALKGQCGPAPAQDSVCAATCKRAADCEIYGSGWECRSRVCAKLPLPRSFDAGGDTPMDAGLDAATGSVPVREVLSDAGPDASAVLAALDHDAGPAAPRPCLNPFGVAPGGCVDLLYQDQPTPTSVAIDATHLYWTSLETYDALGNSRNDGKVVALPLAGGAPVTVADHLSAAGGLVVIGGYAYWIHQAYGDGRTDGAVMRVALSGGTPELVAGNMLNVYGLVADSGFAYFFVDLMNGGVGPRELRRVAKTGSGSPQVLLSTNALPSATALAGGMLYWKDATAMEIDALAADGSGGVQKVTNDGDFDGPVDDNLLLDQGTLYWLVATGQSSTTSRADSSAVGTFALGSMTGNVFAQTKGLPSGLALDDRYAYWGLVDPIAKSSTIERTDKQTGATDALIGGIPQTMLEIAVSSTDIYVLAGDGGRNPTGLVLRIPK